MTMLRQCCATGSLHTGTPTGRIAKLHGLDTYIASPPAGSDAKGIIVIIPDAFGTSLPNNRILADDYAKNGFLVYLPEFMDGFVMPADMMISFKALSATGWAAQLYKFGHALYLLRYFVPFLIYCRPAVAGPRIYDFLRAVKANEGRDLPIGTAGFCWGGQFVTALCRDAERASDGSRLTVAGFVAHPSGLTFPKDIEGIVLPYSCAAAERDFMMPPAAATQTKEILAKKSARAVETGVEHEFVMYKNVDHGFAVRADEDEKVSAKAGKDAELQAVRWFERWFAKPSP